VFGSCFAPKSGFFRKRRTKVKAAQPPFISRPPGCLADPWVLEDWVIRSSADREIKLSLLQARQIGQKMKDLGATVPPRNLNFVEPTTIDPSLDAKIAVTIEGRAAWIGA
jgi:hypothetical protein